MGAAASTASGPPSGGCKRKWSSTNQFLSSSSSSSVAGKRCKTLRSWSPVSLLTLPPVILNDVIEHCVSVTDVECYRIAVSTHRGMPHLKNVLERMSSSCGGAYGSTLTRDTKSLSLVCKLVRLHVMTILLREIHIHFDFGLGFPLFIPCKATVYSAARLDTRLVRKLCIRVDNTSIVQGWNWALNKMDGLGWTLYNVRVIELQLRQDDRVPVLSRVYKTIGDYLEDIMRCFRNLEKVVLSGHPSHEWVMEIRKSTPVRVEIRSAARPWITAEELRQMNTNDDMNQKLLEYPQVSGEPWPACS